MENVRLIMQSETQFEDEAMGMSSANVLATEEILAMDQAVKEQMMLGVDLEEEDEKANEPKPTELEKEAMREYQERA